MNKVTDPANVTEVALTTDELRAIVDALADIPGRGSCTDALNSGAASLNYALAFALHPARHARRDERGHIGRRLVTGIALAGALAFGVAACGNYPAPTGSNPLSAAVIRHHNTTANTCPTDGTTFAYGSCVLPAGVTDPGPIVDPGAPSEITDPVGCGLQVVPAGYTVDGGPYVCMTAP